MAKKSATKSGKNQPRTSCEEVPVKPARKKSPKAQKDVPKAKPEAKTKPEVEAKVAPDAKPERGNFTIGANWSEIKLPPLLDSDRLIDEDEVSQRFALSASLIKELRAESQESKKSDLQKFPEPFKTVKQKEYWSLSAMRRWYWCRVFQSALNSYHRVFGQKG